MPTSTDDRGVLPDEVPLGVTLDRTCVGCGTDYQWTSREGWQWPTSYCTRACKRRSAQNRLVRFTDPQDADAAEGMLLLICARCEDPFGWVPRPAADGRLSPPSYCSSTCATAFRLKRRKERQLLADEGRALRRAEHEANVAAKQQRLAEKAAREGRIAEATQLREQIAQQQREAAQRQREEAQQRQAGAEARSHAEMVAAESAASRELMLPGCRCAICGKVASLDKEMAKQARRRIADVAGNHNEVRYYQCPGSGFWHWTSQV